jgi:hypothetical protein
LRDSWFGWGPPSRMTNKYLPVVGILVMARLKEAASIVCGVTESVTTQS